jgi:hypothetical protein
MSKPSQAEPAYTLVCSASGQAEANLIQSVLEAAGIPVLKFGESAGSVYGFTLGELGRVDLWVPTDRLAEAQAIIAELNTPE